MRARIKKRQMYRRVTIVGVVLAVLLLLIVGLYTAYKASLYLEGQIGLPVSTTDVNNLRSISLASYSYSGSALLSKVQTYSGGAWGLVHGKPLVVYVGADFCPYCAVQRWAILMTFMRFGNFSGLTYMASAIGDGDYPTFSFHGSTYTSRYVVFQGLEQEDRGHNALDTVPSNYTTIFNSYGGSYPFMDFGNRYIVSGALLLPNPMSTLDWGGIFHLLNSSTTFGTQMKEAANLMTSLVCKLTNGQPGSVCSQAQISGATAQLQSYSPSLPGLSAAPAVATQPWVVRPARNPL